MRTGQNPAKSIKHVAQPEQVTVAVVTYIPFLSGYYSESLDVLKVCLESLWRNTDMPYDLVVFDNASCSEVRDYLMQSHANDRIQYLLLSERNIGKGGAWNFVFGGAPGEYIAYSDGDIYFYPGWLSAQVGILETLPKVGMVTGTPMWSPEEFSTSTIKWAEENLDADLERGVLLSWEDYWKHARSLGHTPEKAREHYSTCQEYRFEYQGQKYFIGAGHFQFMARCRVLQSVLPIPSERPMGQVRQLDIALNDKGYLRLSTQDWWVQHIGNTLSTEFLESSADWRTQPQFETKKQLHQNDAVPKNKPGFWRWPPVRKFLQWTHGKSFEILYRN